MMKSFSIFLNPISIPIQMDYYYRTFFISLSMTIEYLKHIHAFCDECHAHNCVQLRALKYRSLLAKDFQEFIVLTVQGSPSSKKDKATSNASNGKNSIYLKRKNSKYSHDEACMPNVLPPPEKSAMLLRKKALEHIEQWSEVYGDVYPSFKKGHDYVEKVLKFQFPKLREHRLDTARIEAERKRHTQIILMQKFKKIRDEEFDEQYIHIEVCLRQLDACLNQIVPTFENMMKDALLQEEKAEEEVKNNRQDTIVLQHVNDDSTVTLDADHSSSSSAVATIFEMENTSSHTTTMESVSDGNDLDNNNDDENKAVKSSFLEEYDQYEEEEEDHNPENNEENEWEEVMIEKNDNQSDEMDMIFSSAEEMMRDVGIFSNDYEIMIDLKDIFKDNETVDNEALFEICKENLHALKKIYLPQIKEWMRIMTSVELIESSDISIRQQMIMKCIDIKNRMNDIFEKCEKLGIAETQPRSKTCTRNMEEQLERARLIEKQIVQDLISQRKKRKGSPVHPATTCESVKKIKR